jgi:nicotinate-nucleotide adenylyltransferase
VVVRIGVFGGTFDPIHTGHVVAAVSARHALDLSEVLVVPAGDPWQKAGAVRTSATDRLAVVAAAIEGVEGLRLCALEVERSGPSYTVDTLRALAGTDRELVLVLGADAVRGIASWSRSDEIRELATIAVVQRAGDSVAMPPGPGWHTARVEIPRLDISSTDLRDRLARGAPVDGLMPPAAIRVVRERRLYTAR